MTSHEFNFALAKCNHELDFMALASTVFNDEQTLDVKHVRVHSIIRAAYWRGYDRSTKNAIRCIEQSVRIGSE